MKTSALVPVSLFKELSGPMNSTFVTTTGYGIEHWQQIYDKRPSKYMIKGLKFNACNECTVIAISNELDLTTSTERAVQCRNFVKICFEL